MLVDGRAWFWRSGGRVSRMRGGRVGLLGAVDVAGGRLLWALCGLVLGLGYVGIKTSRSPLNHADNGRAPDTTPLCGNQHT